MTFYEVTDTPFLNIAGETFRIKP